MYALLENYCLEWQERIVLPDVRIPEGEERRLLKQCNSQKKGKFITDSNQGSCQTSNTVVRGQRAPSRGGYPNL